MRVSVAQGLLAASTFGVLLALPERAEAEDVMLSCNDSHIVLYPDKGQAELLDHDPVVIGSLTVKDNAYLMIFPATEKNYEINIRVNRHTGKFEWEHGQPPFFEFNTDNLYRSGTCAVIEAVRKF